jgi:folylpolyglutamate synthase/dihydropteroate synthase
VIHFLEIAFEKAGIIKAQVPVVIGEFHEETHEVFENKAMENGQRLFSMLMSFLKFKILKQIFTEVSLAVILARRFYITKPIFQELIKKRIYKPQ